MRLHRRESDNTGLTRLLPLCLFERKKKTDQQKVHTKPREDCRKAQRCRLGPTLHSGSPTHTQTYTQLQTKIMFIPLELRQRYESNFLKKHTNRRYVNLDNGPQVQKDTKMLRNTSCTYTSTHWQIYLQTHYRVSSVSSSDFRSLSLVQISAHWTELQWRSEQGGECRMRKKWVSKKVKGWRGASRRTRRTRKWAQQGIKHLDVWTVMYLGKQYGTGPRRTHLVAKKTMSFQRPQSSWRW